MKKPGLLVVISSPSGGGKTTVRKRIVRMFEDAEYSISCTTRPPRKGEVDGRDYRFVRPARFETMIREDRFLEHANVFGHLYGTPRDFVTDSLKKNRLVILDIDVQGAMQIKKKMEGIFIYLVPPSMKTLRDRLVRRKTDDKKTIERRLNDARKELTFIDKYDYAVVNEKLRETVEQVRAIIIAERCRTKHVRKQVKEII